MKLTACEVTRGDLEAGLCGAAHKLLTIATLLPSSFTQAIFPVLSGYYHTRPHKVIEALPDCLRAMALVSVPMAAGAVALAQGIISLIYPPEFSRSAAALAILLGSCSLGHLNWVMTIFLAAANRQRFITFATLAAGAAVVVSNLILVPKNGYLATAWILALAEAALFLSFAAFLRRAGFSVRVASILGKPILSAVIMAVGLRLLPDVNVLFRVLLGWCLWSTDCRPAWDRKTGARSASQTPQGISGTGSEIATHEHQDAHHQDFVMIVNGIQDVNHGLSRHILQPAWVDRLRPLPKSHEKAHHAGICSGS